MTDPITATMAVQTVEAPASSSATKKEGATASTSASVTAAEPAANSGSASAQIVKAVMKAGERNKDVLHVLTSIFGNTLDHSSYFVYPFHWLEWFKLVTKT